MKTTEEIFIIIKQKFNDDILNHVKGQPVEEYIEAKPAAIDQICLYLRNTEDLMFDNLMNLSAVDDFNGHKIKDESGKEIMSGGTLSVFYHLESMKLNQKVTLKISTNRDNPEVNSVDPVWHSANWHEREAFDLFGIKFLNHPDLSRILMPYDWEFGYPLRKDYENPEFYHGMKVPY